MINLIELKICDFLTSSNSFGEKLNHFIDLIFSDLRARKAHRSSTKHGLLPLHASKKLLATENSSIFRLKKLKRSFLAICWALKVKKRFTTRLWNGQKLNQNEQTTGLCFTDCSSMCDCHLPSRSFYWTSFNSSLSSSETGSSNNLGSAPDTTKWTDRSVSVGSVTSPTDPTLCLRIEICRLVDGRSIVGFLVGRLSVFGRSLVSVTYAFCEIQLSRMIPDENLASLSVIFF